MLEAGQVGNTADVLAFVADGQAQLVVGHGDAAAFGLAGQQLDLDDLGRGQGGRDELGDVLQRMTSIFSPFSSWTIFSRGRRGQLMQAPTGSIVGFLLQTASLVRAPASRAMAFDLDGAVVDPELPAQT